MNKKRKTYFAILIQFLLMSLLFIQIGAIAQDCPLGTEYDTGTVADSDYSSNCNGEPLFMPFSTFAAPGNYSLVNDFVVGNTYCFHLFDPFDLYTEIASNYLFTIYDLNENVVAVGVPDSSFCFTVAETEYNIQVNLNDGNCGNDGSNGLFATALCANCPPMHGCTDSDAFNFEPAAICDDGSCIYASDACPILPNTNDLSDETPPSVNIECDGTPEMLVVNPGAFIFETNIIPDLIAGETYCIHVTQNLFTAGLIGFVNGSIDYSNVTDEDLIMPDFGANYWVSVYDFQDNLLGVGPGDGTVCFEATSGSAFITLNYNDGNCGVDFDVNSTVSLAMSCPSCSSEGGCTDPLAINYIPEATCDIGNCVYGADNDSSLKVFMEGAYNPNTGMMETSLFDIGVLPDTQPYNVPPYNYTGTESINTAIDGIVDWVLVELRTGTPSLIEASTSVYASQAGLLLTDGRIVDANTGNAIAFEGVGSGDFHIVIRHRNHLDVMSATYVDFIDGILSYDFTDGVSKALGPNQLKSKNGVAVLYGAEFSSDGVIQVTDYDLWDGNNAAINVYEQGDANLDGVIQTTDYDLWFENKSKLGIVEIRY